MGEVEERYLLEEKLSSATGEAGTLEAGDTVSRLNDENGEWTSCQA